MNKKNKTSEELSLELNTLKQKYATLEANYQKLIREGNQSDKALKESNIKFESLASNIPAHIAYVNADSLKYEYVNEAFEKSFGIKREKIIGSHIKEIIGEANYQFALKYINEVKLGKSVSYENFFDLLSGRRRIKVNYTPGFDSNGNVISIIVLSLDITESKKTDEMLTSSENLFRSVWENSRDGMRLTDKDGIMIKVNQAFCTLSGKLKEDLEDKPLSEIYIGKVGGKILEAYKANVRSSQIKPYIENEYSLWDGTRKWFGVSSSRFDQNGNNASVLSIFRDISENKRAEEEIKNNEKRLRTLAEILQYQSNTVQGFLDHALNEAIKLTGSKIGYIYHYSEEKKEFILNSWSTDVMKECNILERQSVYQLEKTGLWGEAIRQRKAIVVNDFQAQNPLKNGYPEGHAKLYKYLASPILINAKIVGVVVVANKETDYNETDTLQLTLLMDAVWNVVEQKQAEESLRKNIDKFDSLFNSMTEMVVLHELVFNEDDNAVNYRIIDSNNAFTEITGISKEYAQGKLATDVYQITEAPYLELFSKVALTGQSNNITTYFEPMDKYFVISIVSPGKNQFATITTDITNIKKIEAALRQSEEKFKNLIWDMNVGVLLQGPKAEIIMNNPCALELLGLNEDQLLGRTSFDPNWNVIHEDGSPFPGSDHPVPQAIAARHSVKDVVMGVYRPAKGDRVWLLVDAIPQFNEDGTIRQVICTFINITDRITYQNKIQSMNEDLKVLNNSKDKFFSIISHDLRSPFQGFIGLTESIYSGIDKFSIAELSELSKVLHFSAKNLFKMLGNLLDWARMQQGTLSFDPREMILSNLVSRNINYFFQRGEQKGIELISEIPENQKVFADESMLDSILRNLISNAVKFTNQGGKVTVISKNIDNNMVEISVSDSGIGMHESLVENLFKIEEKVGRRGTDGENSSGLGLLLCKEFVEKHGGKIWVESMENVGTTFYFTLPIVR